MKVRQMWTAKTPIKNMIFWFPISVHISKKYGLPTNKADARPMYWFSE